MRRSKTLVYLRGNRWWADFRQYADAGGRQEPLCAPGQKLATTDRAIAAQLYAERVKALEQARRDKVVLGVTAVVGLEGYAARHLVDMAKAGKVTDDWLAYHQTALERAVAYFGGERALTSIGAKDVKAYVQHLAALPSGRHGGTLSPKAFRHSYASARLQTLENGAPVAIWTVSHELGHGSETMLRTIYGHLGQVRHRSDVVEYRVEQHREALSDRQAALGISQNV